MVTSNSSQAENSADGQKGGNKARVEELRTNRRIKVPEIRVISEDGEQLGIMPTLQALRRAESIGLDLVEIQPRSKPPVCKIMDHGKYKYELSRKLSESRKKQQQIEVRLI